MPLLLSKQASKTSLTSIQQRQGTKLDKPSAYSSLDLDRMGTVIVSAVEMAASPPCIQQLKLTVVNCSPASKTTSHIQAIRQRWPTRLTRLANFFLLNLPTTQLSISRAKQRFRRQECRALKSLRSAKRSSHKRNSS